MQHILALDLGTSSLKAVLMTEAGRVCFVHARPYPSLYPKPGWVEQDPAEWETALREVLKAVLAEVRAGDIAAISFSGHMSAVVLLDGAGNPLCNAITLSDARSAKECRELEKTVGPRIFENTCNPVITAFAAPKLLWLAKHRPELMKAAKRYVAPKDYLRALLCGKIAAERTDAANSLLLGRDGRWDWDLIEETGLSPDLFPPILGSNQVAGYVTAKAAGTYGLREGTPVVAGAADMAAGALGMGLLKTGDAAVTIGTSATFLCGVNGPDGAGGGAVTYHPHALEGGWFALGSHFNGGLALNWFSRLFSATGEIEYPLLDALAAEAAKLPPLGQGVLALPFLVGSGSPYFNPGDAGAFLGLTQVSDKAALFKALLEGISLNLRESLVLFQGLCGGKLTAVSVGGGGIKTEGWVQMLSDVFALPCRAVRCPDASAVGAAILGGNAVGMFPDMPAAAENSIETRAEYRPDPLRAALYSEAYPLYQKACLALRGLNGGLREIVEKQGGK